MEASKVEKAENMMAEQIFISYRRSGGDVVAGFLYEALCRKGYTVFYDLDSIHGGYFDERILTAIDGCEDVLLVLPKGALDRCVNEDDWVRQEIRRALSGGKNIVPVLIDGFEFPKNLPEDIQEVSRYNGVPFIMVYRDAVIETIIDRLTAKPRTDASFVPSDDEGSAGLKFYKMVSGGYGVQAEAYADPFLDEDLVIPAKYLGETVTAIASSAFRSCKSIRTVRIPEGVRTIGKNAFTDCESLAEITLPRRVSDISNTPFSGCPSLMKISADPQNLVYASVGPHLYSKDLKTVVRYAPACRETDVVIPGGVTEIASFAFGECASMKHISIPETVTTIGWWAFTRCTSLKEITLPSGVEQIPVNAFSGCTSLHDVTLPASITRIGEFAFYNCPALTSIRFLGTVAEWKRIERDFSWDSPSGIRVVHCTDGDVPV